MHSSRRRPVSAAGAGPTPAGTAAASLATRVTAATIGLGSGFADGATLTVAPGGPPPTGTISFSVYGPSDPACTGAVVFSSTNTLVMPATASSSFTPPNVGTYQVIARYAGDSVYGPAASACGDPAETVVVGRRPTLTAISPSSGPAAGQNTVTITGTDLAGASTVDFGALATPATVIDSTEVIATAPAGSGAVDVTVTTPFGTTATFPGDVYAYAAAAAASAPPTSLESSFPRHLPCLSPAPRRRSPLRRPASLGPSLLAGSAGAPTSSTPSASPAAPRSPAARPSNRSDRTGGR